MDKGLQEPADSRGMVKETEWLGFYAVNLATINIFILFIKKYGNDKFSLQ